MSETECPYLFYKQSLSCQACTGYVCRAYGREKKLSDVDICKNDYFECQRYVDASGLEPTITVTDVNELETTISTKDDEPTIVEEPKPEVIVKNLYIKAPCGCQEDIKLSACPYQSTVIPEGKSSCTGVWCYANNKNIRVPKNCWNWQICTVYLMSKFKGVPYP